MTISAVYSADTYAGDGSTTTFPITFEYLSVSTNVKVSIKVDSTGILTLKTAGTHYNVSGSNVVFTAGNIPASGETILIELNPDFKQTTDYAENSSLPAGTLETDLDERCLESQYNNSLVTNSLKVDSATAANLTSTTIVTSSTALTNADKYIKFDSAGTGFEVQTLSSVAGLGNIVEDTTPQLGGNLDVNTNSIVSTSNGNITLAPNGVGNVVLGTMTLDADQSIGAGQDNYVLTYDNGTGLISLEVSPPSDLVNDTTPQLGGDLDMNGNQITSPDGTDLIDIPNGSINLQTASMSRLDITDSGVRLGAANARVTTILDEDTMASDSATALATQQSIKAYVDSQAITGGLVYLASATASASASLSFESNIDTTYGQYLIIGNDLIPATDDVGLVATLGYGGTPTYLAATYKSIMRIVDETGVDDFVASTTNITIAGNNTGQNIGNTAEGCCFIMNLYNPGAATRHIVTGHSGYLGTDTAQHITQFMGSNTDTNALTAIKFAMTSGNITSGTIRLYGIVNS